MLVDNGVLKIAEQRQPFPAAVVSTHLGKELDGTVVGSRTQQRDFPKDVWKLQSGLQFWRRMLRLRGRRPFQISRRIDDNLCNRSPHSFRESVVQGTMGYTFEKEEYAFGFSKGAPERRNYVLALSNIPGCWEVDVGSVSQSRTPRPGGGISSRHGVVTLGNAGCPAWSWTQKAFLQLCIHRSANCLLMI